MSTGGFVFFPITGLPSSSIPYFVVPVSFTNGGDSGLDGVGFWVGSGVEVEVGSGGAVLTTDVGLGVGDSPSGEEVDGGVADDELSELVLFSSLKQPVSPPTTASAALVRNLLRDDCVILRGMIGRRFE